MLLRFVYKIIKIAFNSIEKKSQFIFISFLLVLTMFDTIPFVSQPYNDSIFRIAVYNLFEQEPGITSWTLDNIIYKLHGRSTPAYFKDLLPLPLETLKDNVTTIRLPKEKKVTYLWICQKLLQLLLWTEGSIAKNPDYLIDLYKISFEEINENAQKIQQIMSDYASHPTSNPVLLRFNQPVSAESSTLPSYQNVISNQGRVGTSTLSVENFSETSGHARENSTSSSSSNTNHYQAYTFHR
jgi:hypothetical protein